jgi:hypothetical protein
VFTLFFNELIKFASSPEHGATRWTGRANTPSPHPPRTLPGPSPRRQAHTHRHFERRPGPSPDPPRTLPRIVPPDGPHSRPEQARARPEWIDLCPVCAFVWFRPLPGVFLFSLSQLLFKLIDVCLCVVISGRSEGLCVSERLRNFVGVDSLK